MKLTRSALQFGTVFGLLILLLPIAANGQTCGQACGQTCGQTCGGQPPCQGQSGCDSCQTGCGSSCGGAGTELKKIYARFGLVPSPNCSCHETARIMDQHPAQWSRDNIQWIECRIQQAAPGLGVKYRPILARRTIKMAIRRAARKER